MNAVVDVHECLLPYLMSHADRSVLNRLMQKMRAPRKPSGCIAVRRCGPGGSKLTRAHMPVNWMYYTLLTAEDEEAIFTKFTSPNNEVRRDSAAPGGNDGQ